MPYFVFNTTFSYIFNANILRIAISVGYQMLIFSTDFLDEKEGCGNVL